MIDPTYLSLLKETKKMDTKFTKKKKKMDTDTSSKGNEKICQHK